MQYKGLKGPLYFPLCNDLRLVLCYWSSYIAMNLISSNQMVILAILKFLINNRVERRFPKSKGMLS